MSTRRPTGAVTPDGSDPISGLVTDLRNLGLTSNRIPTAASQSAAQAIADALASTPYPATTDNGLYVWRSDLRVLTRFDGTAWTDVTPRDTGWVDVPCVASNSTVQARRVGDRVSLRGDLYNSGNASIGGNSITGVLGTLPELFRAPKSQWTLCNSWVAGLPSTSTAYGRPLGLVVYENGGLLLQNPQSQAITCAQLWGVNLWTS